MAFSSALTKVGSNGGSPLPGSAGSSESGAEERGRFEYYGWVYHLGVNSIGHEYCHLRFLFISGKYVEMYKRDPHDNPGIKPIRRGVVGYTLMVEELGRRKVNHGDVYLLRFYNRLDETKKGEIACATAGEARKWMEAFDHAKQQAEYEVSRAAGTRNKLNMETEINLEGHRPRVRRYAHGLRNLIRIGQGPETLLRKSSNLATNVGSDGYFQGDDGDVIEAHEWKCVRMVNGIRIFEDVADSKSGKSVLVKAVGVVNANADTVFEVILNVDRHQRYEWDMLTSDLELVDSVNGHYDVVYGTYDPRHLSRWQSKRDFVFSRQWFRGQDGTYTILQFPTVHKKYPPKSGYRRTKINPSTWEIKSLNTSPASNFARCLVTQILEIDSVGWRRWKNIRWSKLEKTVPYALLSQVAGKFLEGKRPHLYWTPSVAHCLDLMLDDIFKILNFNKTFEKTIAVHDYIVSRSGLLNMMRRFSQCKDLIKPKTRFATTILTLSRIHQQQTNLKKMFTSEEWTTSKWAKEPQGKKTAQVILMPSFWNTILYALRISSPLVRVLQLVDGERKPPMGYIYEAIDRAKEAIAKSFNGNEEKYKEFFEIIDNRWNVQLHRPLHAAGYYLNPEYFYSNPNIEKDKEVLSGLYKCIQRLVPNSDTQDKVCAELTSYKKVEGLFGMALAIRQRTTRAQGLKEYIGGNPSLTFESSTTFVQSKFSNVSSSNGEYEDSEVADEFYDAIADDSSSSDEDSDNEVDINNKDKKVKLKNVSWAIVGLALKRTSAPGLKKELDTNVPPIILDRTNYHGSMRQGKDETDTNCWTSPSGTGFMIRGKTYLKDNRKVMGGDPLLKLIAVDWFKVENCISKVALHPSSLVQSEAGKRLPFVLIFNIEVPARPNYSLVLYYAADRPVNKNSLLGKFVDGSDMFRDSRFKLIPRIVEGYWMVKRAVGTKACLLGKAVTCEYLRQDNFLEIDVDIGSSSVARSIISLVLGYVTSIVVDLAILIEAKEEAELPECILGAVRLNRVKLDSAVPFEV